MVEWQGFKQILSRKTLLLTLVAGLYWIWWDSFHEIGRFFMQVPLPFDFILLRYSSVSCLFRPVGIVLGCLLVCFLLRGFKQALANKRLPSVLFAIELALHVLYYALVIDESYALSCFVYAVISVCAVPSIMLVALQVKRCEKREIVIIVIGSIACYGLFNNLLFPCVLLAAPLLAIGIVYLAALVAAYALSQKAFGQTLELNEPNRESSVRTPLPLVVHLFVYGLAFGILHVIGGTISRGPYLVNIAVLLACVVTIACLIVLFLRKSSNHEIWSKIRSTVFPLSVIGYLLIPLVPNSDGALSLTEAGNLLYNSIFFIGCFTLMRKTDVDPRTILAKGLLYKNIGAIVGILWARQFYERVLLNGTIPPLLPVIIVLLLTIATFWIGSDEQIRKIWGLRKKLTPKQYNDLVLQRKCSMLSDDHGLTAREGEILLLLAQGMRAPEIQETLGVSMDTVRSHIKHLYAKLNVHSIKEVQGLLRSLDVNDEDLE